MSIFVKSKLLFLQDKSELEKKCRELKKLETEIGGEEKLGKQAEEAVRRARSKMEALAKGMITDEDGHAVTLDAQLTGPLQRFSVIRVFF